MVMEVGLDGYGDIVRKLFYSFPDYLGIGCGSVGWVLGRVLPSFVCAGGTLPLRARLTPGRRWVYKQFFISTM